MKDTNQDKATARPYSTPWRLQANADWTTDIFDSSDGFVATLLTPVAKNIVRAVNQFDALNAVAEAAQKVYDDPYTTCACADKLREALTALAAVRKQNGGAS